MNVFAIGDLHLPGKADKSMDVFGERWANHQQRIADSWRANVGQDDIVLIPGDFSWAMRLEQTAEDFLYLEELPGRKVLLRGNHDYWWNSLSKVRAFVPPSVTVLQNDTISFPGVHICGTRGWLCPGTSNFSSDDRKIYEREAGRLRLSLKGLADQNSVKIAMMHFSPFNDKHEESAFSMLLEEAGVDLVVYAHLHGKATRNAFEGTRGKTSYTLVSADHIGFSPKWIAVIG